MKKEVNGVVGIIIVLLVVIILLLASILLFNNNNNTNNVQKENESTEKEYAKIENIDTIAKNFYDNYVEKMMSINSNVIFKSNKKKVNIAELSYNTRMSLLLYASNFDWEYSSPGYGYIEESKIADAYLKIFGSSGYLKETFANVTSCPCPATVFYDSTNSVYRADLANCGCGRNGSGEKYIFNSSEQIKDKIKLYVNVGYIAAKTETHGELFSDYTKINKIAEVEYGEDISKYKDQFGMLSFTLVKDNNNYVLESIEVVK